MFLTKNLKTMRVKILETRNIIGYNSKEFRNYQVSFKEKKVWISELDYTKYPDLLSFEDEYIILKEPVRDNFILNEKENKNGKFLTLIPKQTGSINIVEDPGNSDISTNRKSNQSNTEAHNREGNLESEIIDDYLDMLGDKGKLFESLDLAIFSINQLKYDDFECIENFRAHTTLKEFHKDVFDNPNIIELIKLQINRVVGVLKNIENDIQKVKSIIETNSDTATSSDETNFIGKTRVKLNIIQSIIEKTTSSKTDMGIIVLQGKRLGRNFEFIKDQLSIVLEETKAFNSLRFNLESHKQVQGLSRLDDLSDKFTFRVEKNTIAMYDEIIQELTEKGKGIDRLLGTLTSNIGLPNEVETIHETQVLSVFPKDKPNSKKTTSPKQVAKHQENKKNVNRVENSAKVYFINGLLKMSNRKDVSEKTKDRLVELLSKEVGGNDGLLKEIYKDVKEIKERVSLDQPKLNKEEVEGQLKSEEKSQFPKYIDPIKLYSFLFNYNQDPILKYTCHDIDSDGLKDIVRYCNTEQYDFKKHIEKIKEVYAGFEKKHYAPIAVKALIRGYLTGKNFKGNELEQGWSTDRININWSHSDILNWSKENPNFPPNPNEGLIEQNENIGFEIKRFVSVITGKTVQNFRELVVHFKNLFHIRRDNSLKDLIEFKNQNKRWNDVIDFVIDNNEFPKNIEFFTDVDKLTQAYTRIVELIIEQHKKSQIPEKPKVKLSFFENEGSLEFSIHHLNSVFGKTIVNAIERPGVAYTNLINKQINGLCNLYVRADFGQGNFAKINIWNGKERESQLIESFKGVEHLLEFPKK